MFVCVGKFRVEEWVTGVGWDDSYSIYFSVIVKPYRVKIKSWFGQKSVQEMNYTLKPHSAMDHIQSRADVCLTSGHLFLFFFYWRYALATAWSMVNEMRRPDRCGWIR